VLIRGLNCAIIDATQVNIPPQYPHPKTMSRLHISQFLIASWICSLALLLGATAITTQAADKTDKSAPARKISYDKDIRPIFQTHCQGCHQPSKKGGDYVMTDFSLLLKST
jgi:mono/diheme cytochrome c family protein